MPKTLNTSARTAITIGASVTNYIVVSPNSINSGDTTEAITQSLARTVGVYSLLYVNVIANDRAASTVKFRKNGADGSMVVSITGSTTGEFEDLTTTDTVASGDLINYQIVTGSGGSTFIIQVYSTVFRADQGTVISHGIMGGGFSTASTTAFANMGGHSAWTVTEADAQWKSKVAGTLRNLFVKIGTNARTTTTTFGSRVNGASGTLTLSVGSTATGNFEDVSNSDAVTYDQPIGFYETTGTGTGNIQVSLARMEFYTTNGYSQLITAGVGAVTVNAAVTTNFPISGRMDAEPTESEIKADAQIPMTLSHLQCYVSANTVVGASTVKLRKNAADGAQTASITSLTTGWFEDTTNIDQVASTDEINYQIITGGTGTSLALRSIGCLAYTKTPRFFLAM